MKLQKRFALVLGMITVIAGLASPENLWAQAHTPKTVYGAVTNSDGSVPAPASIIFDAYIQARPSEVLHQNSSGCGVETVGADAQYYLECGNFATQWASGDVLVIAMSNTSNGETATKTLTLDNGGLQRQDVNLSGVPPTILVTVQANPSGRSFTVDGTTYTSATNLNWVSGSSHTIATTSPQSGGTGVQYVFSSWSDGGAISHTVAPTSAMTYTANFTTQYYLTMNMGSGGSLVSPASGWYNSGTNVSINATANSGYSFSSWTGSGSGSYSGNNQSSTVTMNGPITETASFTVNPTRIIGVSGNLVFGSVTTGTTVTATLTISNSGNTNLTVTSISYPTGFSGPFSGSIAAGGSTNVTVTFAPVALLAYSGTVTVNSDKTSGTNTIPASGIGIAVVPPATRIIALSGNLAFDNVTTGTTATATLTISNSGNTNLTVSSISYPAGFSGPFSGSIAAGGSTNVTVTFAPVALLAYSGTVMVNSDRTSGVNTITASGAGVSAAGELVYCGLVSPTNVNGLVVGMVAAGEVYQYEASGCVVYSPGIGYRADPDGNVYSDSNCSVSATDGGTGFLCPNLAPWSLIATVGDGPCIQLGSNGSFVAPSAGVLRLYLNDGAGSFGDNSGEWQVCVSRTTSNSWVDGWEPWWNAVSDPANNRFVNDPLHERGSVLQILGQNGWQATFRKPVTGSSRTVAVQGWFMSSGGIGGPWVTLRQSFDGCCMATDLGSYGFTSGATPPAINGVPLASNVWYQFSFVLNATEGWWKGYLGGGVTATGSVDSARTVNWVCLDGGIGSPGYFSDVTFSTDVTRDLAVVSIKAPKTVGLSATKPSLTKMVKVQIQNLSSNDATITNYADFVGLLVESLGECADPSVTVHAGAPNKPLPIVLAPNKKLTVVFDVTFNCYNDPLKGIGHEDYSYSAVVGETPDSHPENDECPRLPNPAIGDKGCGGKGGSAVVTDVVIK